MLVGGEDCWVRSAARGQPMGTINGPTTVALVQINNSFSGQNYLPYSVACLQSYVQGHAENPDRFQFLDFIYKRMPIHTIVDRIKDADLVGFSTYVWNIRVTLEVARRLKAKRPGIRIVCGGPQVPDHPEPFLRANPQIDLVFHNEAERSFLQYLASFPDGDLSAIPGISWIDADGVFRRNPAAERIRDLNEVPSPFLDGIFDDLMVNNPEEAWIGLWETNRGCPFKCSFCDWGSATASKVTKFDIDRLSREADWFSEKRIGYVFVCDANFGMLPRDLDIARRVAGNRAKTGFPQGFSVQNTKNATERAYGMQKILSDAGLNKGVALSMQSLYPEALNHIRRDNISLEMYLELQRRFTRDGVETYSDLILGLPGETYESFVDGIDQLLESGQHNRIQFNNCAILPNAEMGSPEYIARFQIETIETEIVNIHGRRELLEDDVPEMQDLVVSTYSLSQQDWRRCRAVAWMSALLHFNKILQIPIILLHETAGVRYRDIFEQFMEVEAREYPQLASIRDFFIDEAAKIQAGGTEYILAPEWLGIYWPMDEYVFIKMTAEKTLSSFYDEASGLLRKLALGHGGDERMLAALADAIRLNRALLHQPFEFKDIEVELNYNVQQVYQGTLKGERVKLRSMPVKVRIDRARLGYDDFQTWCREIVWWGNKKGAYLYSNTITSVAELAGHY
jgi:radical SAM superfamily enzyme YgiQ (UPF0313 family)